MTFGRRFCDEKTTRMLAVAIVLTMLLGLGAVAFASSKEPVEEKSVSAGEIWLIEENCPLSSLSVEPGGEIAAAEEGQVVVFFVDGHYYTQSELEEDFGAEDGSLAVSGDIQVIPAIDSDASWDLSGLALLTLSDARNDEAYADDALTSYVDYAIVDGESVSGNPSGSTAGSAYDVVTNDVGAEISFDESGNIRLDYDLTAYGDGVTAAWFINPAVYSAGQKYDGVATLTGNIVLLDDSDGFHNNDFTGMGVAVVAAESSAIHIKDAFIYSSGYGRDALIVDDCATVLIEDSTISVDGGDPLDADKIYEGFSNNADFSCMQAAPWILGMNGSSRTVNMIGNNCSAIVANSTVTTTGWALLSVDFYTSRADQDTTGVGSGYGLVTIDSDLIIYNDEHGGLYSGSDIFGYDTNYGTGYGNYSGGAKFYGTHFQGLTYSCIVAGGTKYFGRSDGTFTYDINGETFEVEGKSQPCVIDTVFGIMVREQRGANVTFDEGTIINSAESTVILRGCPANIYFNDADANPANGVLVSLLDDEENALTDGRNGEAGPNTFCLGASIDHGWASDNGNVTEQRTSSYTTNIYLNSGEYEGNMYNASGYYGESAVDLVVYVGSEDGQTSYTGDVNLAVYMQGMEYSSRAAEAIDAYNDDGGSLTYILIGEDGQETEDPQQAKYIQLVDYSQTEYWVFGHVVYKNFVNGYARAEVDVAAGSTWTPEESSVINMLVVEDGASVYGHVAENGDGTITVTPSDSVLPAGTYGSLPEIEITESTSASGEAS